MACVVLPDKPPKCHMGDSNNCTQHAIYIYIYQTIYYSYQCISSNNIPVSKLTLNLSCMFRLNLNKSVLFFITKTSLKQIFPKELSALIVCSRPCIGPSICIYVDIPVLQTIDPDLVLLYYLNLLPTPVYLLILQAVHNVFISLPQIPVDIPIHQMVDPVLISPSNISINTTQNTC